MVMWNSQERMLNILPSYDDVIEASEEKQNVERKKHQNVCASENNMCKFQEFGWADICRFLYVITNLYTCDIGNIFNTKRD